MQRGCYLSTYSDSTPPTGIYHLPATGPKAPHLLSSFSLDCLSADTNDIGIVLGAKQVNGQWVRYVILPDRPNLALFEKGAHPQAVSLKGENWTGVGSTIDETTGDEEKRTRKFSFCLIHNTQALCGNMPVVWLADPKHNDLWMAKEILQSVVFSDLVVPLSASLTLTTGTSTK